MSAESIQCYLCGSMDNVLKADIREKPEGEVDIGIPQENYRRLIYRCLNCSVYFIIHDEYIGPDFYTGRYNEITYQKKIHETYQRIRNLPKEKSDNKNRAERVCNFIDDRFNLPHTQVHILDVGSGLCVFCAELKSLNFPCYCVDPDADSIKHALQNVGVDGAHTGTLDNFETEQKFNFISFNRVLEHIKEPIHTLKKAKHFLSSHGVIYIELPDGDTAVENGGFVDREEFYLGHFTIFNKISFDYLVSSSGYKCLEVKTIHEPSDKYTIYGFLAVL